MSTNPEAPQDAPAPEPDFDELTGVYGFFRRHQKKLLYTAGLFTLLTFSAAGPLNQLVAGVFQKDRELPSITVNGESVKLQGDDYSVGSKLSRNLRVLPPGVLIPVMAGEGGDTELGEVYAILRRASIAEGIEPSMAEVDRAIDAFREQAKLESAAKLAQQRGFGSLAEYRLLVAEAMRVGTYERLQMLAFDTSDAEVMRQVLLHQEKVAFKVATFDEKASQDAMKAASELTDEDLRKWLDEQNDGQKARMGAFDLPTVQLHFAALQWAEGQFKPEEWADSLLKDYTITDDELKTYYDADKETFKVAGTGTPEVAAVPAEGDTPAVAAVPAVPAEYREFEDEGVKAQLTRMAQAQRVMTDLNSKLKQLQLDAVKPFGEEVIKAQGELRTAQTDMGGKAKVKLGKEAALAAKEAELAKAPEDEELKTAVETLKAEVATATDEHAQAELAVAPMQTALDAAKAAEEAARSGFDFRAEFDKLVAGKSGFVKKSMTEQATAEGLEDLDALGLDLGTWQRSAQATTLRSVGAISNGPERTSKATIIYQAQALESRPLKPWDDLKTLVQDAYWTEKSADEGREKSKLMTDALLRLAKEKMPEFVTDLEGKRESRISEKATEWETGVQKDIDEATKMVATPGLGAQARQAWDNKLKRKTNELGTKESRVTFIGQQVDREISDEIAEEAKKHHAAVLAAAAAEAGYTVTDIGPLPRTVVSRPRFRDSFDKTIVYVFQNHGEMKEGESAGPVKDNAERRSHVIACTQVVPMTAADVTRREFEGRRQIIERLQAYNGINQAFTIEALTDRYALTRPVGEQVDQQ